MAAGVEYLARRFDAGAFLLLDQTGRAAVFQTLGATSGALLGFFITTVTIFVAFIERAGDRMESLLSGENMQTASKVFFAGIRAAFGSLVVFLLIAPFFLNDKPLGGVRAVVADSALWGVTILLLLRAGRIIVNLHALIAIYRLDRQAQGK